MFIIDFNDLFINIFYIFNKFFIKDMFITSFYDLFINKMNRIISDSLEFAMQILMESMIDIITILTLVKICNMSDKFLIIYKICL
jgi:hypothetical protein